MTIFVFEEESLDKIENMKEIILSAIDSKNGQDIKVLDVREQTSIADFFIIASGNSSTQVTAIADEIEFKMEESGYEKMNREGHSSARWVLLDYMDIIVHKFHKDEREYYDLERLWETMEKLEMEEI